LIHLISLFKAKKNRYGHLDTA